MKLNLCLSDLPQSRHRRLVRWVARRLGLEDALELFTDPDSFLL